MDGRGGSIDLTFLRGRYTATELAELADVSTATASRWLNGIHRAYATSAYALHAAGVLSDGDLLKAGLMVKANAPATKGAA